MSLRERGFWAIALIYTALHLGYSIAAYNPLTRPVSVDDLKVSFLEAQHWRQTGELTLLGFTDLFYGLLYYLFLSLFSAFPFERIVLFFYLSQFILFPLAILLLLKAVAAKRIALREILLVTVLTLNFQPFLETFASCKVECLEFYLICLAFWGFLKGSNGLAGASVVFGMALKYLPGILGVYFLLKRKWRTVLWCVGWGLVLTAMLWAVFGGKIFLEVGVEHLLALLFSPQVDANEPIAILEWQTLSGTINRLFAQFDSTHTLEHVLKVAGFVWVDQTAWITALGISLKLIFVGIYLWVIWPHRPRQSTGLLYGLEMSLTLLMTVMLLKAVRIHYGVLLLPAFLTAGLLLFQHRCLFGRIEKALFLLAYCLSAVLIPGGLLNQLPPSPIWGQAHARMYYWASLPFYGYLLLFFCIVLCHRRFSRLPEPVKEVSL